ncbi:hypothetical protein TNCV_2743791 [Trichonephila clavipes]|nr:hypothetical protein TNCV_2743791 [Trichonephila clavipes]
MGVRRSPKLQRQFVHLPCLQETDLKGMWGASGQRTLWWAKLYPYSLLPNRNCKIYRQNFEADDFPSGAVSLFKGGRANSRGFYSFFVCQKNPPLPGSAPATRGQSHPSLSPLSKLSSIQLCVT